MVVNKKNPFAFKAKQAGKKKSSGKRVGKSRPEKANYCCPIKSIEYKRISLGHCIFNGRVLFCYSKPL
ncbi:hypothetical protein, partial [Phocaeicola coprophilus]|uniref:hypothetical protein n=1 Tax=Phocaeicola coprophilus TaxID=387090 RepID=UPI00255CCF58